jgi:hypothetical protein
LDTSAEFAAATAATAVSAGAEGFQSTSEGESTVDQLRDRSQAALSILGDFARRRPAAFLAAAAVAGVLASRILGGSREED